MAAKKKKRDFMQACAESPVDFLNQIRESINSSVQELKRSDLMRLPQAKPLCIGAGCKGDMQHELLKEERFSAMWSWPVTEEKVEQLLRHYQQPAGVGEEDEQSAHTIAANAQHDTTQLPKQKKQKRAGGDMPKLDDPGQALQNLMMRGPQANVSKSNSTLEAPLVVGRHSANDVHGQKTNGNGDGFNSMPSSAAYAAHPQHVVTGHLSSHQNTDGKGSAWQLHPQYAHLFESMKALEVAKFDETLAQSTELRLELQSSPGLRHSIMKDIEQTTAALVQQAIQQQHAGNGAGWGGGFQ